MEPFAQKEVGEQRDEGGLPIEHQAAVARSQRVDAAVVEIV
jgi:hypothetical protein